jgi:hypothetical protein
MIFGKLHSVSAASLVRGAVLLLLAAAVLHAGQMQVVHASASGDRERVVDPLAGPWGGVEWLLAESSPCEETPPRAQASGSVTNASGHGIPCLCRQLAGSATPDGRRTSPPETLVLICRLNC